MGLLNNIFSVFSNFKVVYEFDVELICIDKF